jgi:hypothetical protein
MPTISQLPVAQTIGASDSVPISQAGSAHSVSLGSLLASTQPAIIIGQGSLLGRSSLGSGGPEAIGIGAGLMLNASTLQAMPLDCSTLVAATNLNTSDQALIGRGGSAPQLLAISQLRGLFSAGSNVSISSGGVISASGTAAASPASLATLPPTSAAGAQDLIGINQSGTDRAIAYANLINGQTIDNAQRAAAASDSDSFWVAQGSNTMVSQTFSAVWPWIATKLLSVKMPIVEITTNTTIDGTVHNARILVCSQPVTLTPLAANMGNGFQCEVVNLSAGPVSLAGSVISSTGVATLVSGQAASLRCLTYSSGTVVYAFLGDGGTASAYPGQVSALSSSARTNSSVSLSWAGPVGGSAATGYTVEYRLAGTSSWTVASQTVTVPAFNVSGLTAATSYDFCVFATNAAGSGAVSTVVTVSTASAAQAAAVTSIAWNIAPSGSYAHGSGVIGVNAHVTPAAAAVQFGFSTSATNAPSSWLAGSFVNSNLWGAYVPTPAVAGNWYAWASGTDGSAPTAYSTAFTVT